MSPDAIPAYGPDPSDPNFLAPSTGILANFLESCARQVSGYFRNTGIPGTPYTGVDVDIYTRANPYSGQMYNERGRNPVTVGLSIAHSRLELGVSDSYTMQIVLEARIYLPTSPIARSPAEARESERAYRDLRNHAAVVDGIYIVLMEIPFFSGGKNTGQVIPAYSIEHTSPTIPTITAMYEVPVRVSRTEKTIEAVFVDTRTKQDSGHYSWVSRPPE